MWASNASSAFVGGVRDSETALQSIGQYIEDYLDLVENVPNEIVRSITQLHEKSHVYHNQMEKLERALTKLTATFQSPDCNSGNDQGPSRQPTDQEAENRKKQFDVIQKYLVAIQSISDEKLYIVQSIYEQLELKARQLDHDLRLISVGSGNSSLISPMKSTRDASRGYYNSFNDRHPHLNGTNNNNNGGGSIASESSPENNSSEENGSQDASSDHNNGHEVVNGTGRRGGGESRVVNLIASSSKNNGMSFSSQLDDDNEENDADSESPTKERKRSRRTKNSRGGEEREGRGDPNTPSRGGKGGKRGFGGRSKDHNNTVSSHQHNTSSTHHHSISKKSRKRDTGSDSPDFLDDVDPNEPTYCLCNQISFGEMIGCDNNNCQIEWFHFQCVQLTTKPKGKWYCPACRGDRSNIQRK